MFLALSTLMAAAMSAHLPFAAAIDPSFPKLQADAKTFALFVVGAVLVVFVAPGLLWQAITQPDISFTHKHRKIIFVCVAVVILVIAGMAILTTIGQFIATESGAA